MAVATGTEKNKEASEKGASVMPYLMEELGDARMRCDQLLRYIERTRQLIENSDHKDHVFEVAGDLLRSIPDTAFRLQKALQAVALAAGRIDYEEIKQDLRPEKVEELESILEEVRIRPIKRQGDPMNPEQALQQLQQITTLTRQSGTLPVQETLTLIASLEEGLPRVAGQLDLVARLEGMHAALCNPPPDLEPSRQRMAEALRSLLASSLYTPSGVKIGTADDDKQSRHEEGKPADPTKDMSPEDAEKWKANTDKYEDKFKASFAERAARDLDIRDLKQLQKTLEDILVEANKSKQSELKSLAQKALKTIKVASEMESRHEEGKPVDPTKDMSPEDAEKWKANTEEYGDKFKQASPLYEEASKLLSEGIRSWPFKHFEASWGGVLRALDTAQKRSEALHRTGVGTTEDPALVKEHLLPALKNYADDILAVVASLNRRFSGKLSSKQAEEVIQDPDSGQIVRVLLRAYEAGKQAGQQHTLMSDLDGHLKGVSDEIKYYLKHLRLPARAYFVGVSSQIWELAFWKGVAEATGGTKNAGQEDEAVLDSVLLRNPADKTAALEKLYDSARQALVQHKAGNERRVAFQIMSALGSIYQYGNELDVGPKIGLLQQVIRVFLPISGARPTLNLSASTEDDKQSRHEEGKPVDPTKDMSPEDAEAWKANTDKYEDKFKQSSWKA